MALIEEAKGLLAHGGNLNPSLQEVFKRGMKFWVEKKKHEKGITANNPEKELPAAPQVDAASQTHSDPRASIPPSRYIPAPIQKAVFFRAQGRCEYKPPHDGARCTSRHALELHHHHPYGRGGAHSVENLSAYCRVHNAAQARWDARQNRSVTVFG